MSLTSTLQSKELNQYRQALKHYQLREYPKALKCIEAVLKTMPSHGESLCLKGLLLFHNGRQSEAHVSIKEGLKQDSRSSTSWQMLGLLYREENNFLEASRAYKMALRFDPSNTPILRDLSILQFRLGEFQGFNDSRRALLGLVSDGLFNWICLAVSEHLLGRYETAFQVLDKFESLSMQVNGPALASEASEGALSGAESFAALSRLEKSGMRTYQAWLLLLGGKSKECLAFVEKHSREFVNPVVRLELELMSEVLSGNASPCSAKATERAASLLNVKPDSMEYFLAWLGCHESLRGAIDMSKLFSRFEVGLGSRCVLEECVVFGSSVDSLDTMLGLFSDCGASVQCKDSARMLLLTAAMKKDLVAEHARNRLLELLKSIIEGYVNRSDTIYSLCELRCLLQPLAKHELTRECIHFASGLSDLTKLAEAELTEKQLALTSQLCFDASEYEICESLCNRLITSRPADGKAGLYDGTEYLRARAVEKLGRLQECATLMEAMADSNRSDRHMCNLAAVSSLNGGNYSKAVDLVARFVSGTNAEAKVSKESRMSLLSDGTSSTCEGTPRSTSALNDSRSTVVENNFQTMQCMWWLEARAAYALSKGNLDEAEEYVKKITSAFKVFEDDQIDFVMYCCRRITLVEVVRFAQYEHEEVKRTPYRVKALVLHIKILLTRIARGATDSAGQLASVADDLAKTFSLAKGLMPWPRAETNVSPDVSYILARAYRELGRSEDSLAWALRCAKSKDVSAAMRISLSALLHNDSRFKDQAMVRTEDLVSELNFTKSALVVGELPILLEASELFSLERDDSMAGKLMALLRLPAKRPEFAECLQASRALRKTAEHAYYKFGSEQGNLLADDLGNTVRSKWYPGCDQEVFEASS